MSDLIWLDTQSIVFPPSELAFEDPNGLLAAGGDLSVERLVAAYRLGIFPWYDESQPILWWSPSPRMVLTPTHVYFNRSLKKLANKKRFTVSVDKAFSRVIEHCSNTSRGEDNGTWITPEMKAAYIELHHSGFAHSIEVWQGGDLVGGLYGVAINRMFFGESMFSLESGASKIGFATLCVQLKKWGFIGIDCQVHTDYLASFNAKEIPRNEFEALLRQSNEHSKAGTPQSDWYANWQMPCYGIAFSQGALIDEIVDKPAEQGK